MAQLSHHLVAHDPDPLPVRLAGAIDDGDRDGHEQAGELLALWPAAQGHRQFAPHATMYQA